ncbi:MAG: potassium channel family protein [Bacilli bacterium]|nr:potassium channel family protein [Bacilli bacterium]
MEKGVTYTRNVPHYLGLMFGIFAIAVCITTIALSVSDTSACIYTLATSIVCLGINRIFMHINNYKKNMFENIFMTCFIFVLAFLVSLTKINIYFLISSMFGYSLTIIVRCLLKLRGEKSAQMIILNIEEIVLAFLFSFVFFFPAIYAKHATTVSNSNFIVLCFTAMILVATNKNILFPYSKKLKADVISDVIRKSLVKEIFSALLILIILCSLYFTLIEPKMKSYVDGLWYSFSVITTIGFGDVSVVTTLGRILSVILGISGIAVVAVFTSLIVNFYNEMSKKRDEKTLKKLTKEVKEIEESIEENKKEKDE